MLKNLRFFIFRWRVFSSPSEEQQKVKLLRLFVDSLLTLAAVEKDKLPCSFSAELQAGTVYVSVDGEGNCTIEAVPYPTPQVMLTVEQRPQTHGRIEELADPVDATRRVIIWEGKILVVDVVPEGKFSLLDFEKIVTQDVG